MRCVSGSYLREAYPKRKDWSHKGDFGRLLVVGGSRTYSGAPGLAAVAALRTGCDLVTVAAPERAANIIATFSPDLITEPIAGNFLKNWHTHTTLKLTEKADAVLIGSGLGRKRETLTFVQNLLSRIDKPCVIDADAIHGLALNKKIAKNNFIITPHSKEFLVLSGKEPSTNLRERSQEVRRLAKQLGCTILLKGHIDVISDGSSTTINKTGSPYMTKGGTGDTLSGICGALLAMGIEPFQAACSAAYINGLAGELASKKLGPGTLATDVVGHIPAAIKSTMGR